MGAVDQTPNKAPKLGALVPDAESSLAELMQFEGLKTDHWFLRLSVAGRSCGWELLQTTHNSDSEKALAARIEVSEKPVTDVVLAFIGVREHRGIMALMAHIEYYRVGFPTGLPCGKFVREFGSNQKLEAYGDFLCFGARQNNRV